MKNILILAVILFAASFSFVGCSDNPVGDITGPSEEEIVDDHHGDHLTIEQVNAALGLNPNQHFDFTDANVALVCPAGYHLHEGGDICRTEGGYDEEGFDADGWDNENYGRDGYHRVGFDRDGCYPGTFFNPNFGPGGACQTIL